MCEAHQAPLSFESPESSNIDGASYDIQNEVLTVRFRGHERKNGERTPTRTYQSGAGQCSAKLWQEFVQAQSKGKFYAERIRPLMPMGML